MYDTVKLVLELHTYLCTSQPVVFVKKSKGLYLRNLEANIYFSYVELSKLASGRQVQCMGLF